MIALLLNTCGAEGIVALADEAGVRAEERLPLRGTSEALMPAVRRVLGGLAVRELGAVGVVLGPGSFTGSRVGLAAAKGLCEAGGVGLVGMSRLGLVAMEADGVEVNVFLGAGRGEYFCGVYRAGLMVSEGLVTGEEAMRRMGERESLTCEVGVSEGLVEARWQETVRVVSEPAGFEMAAMVRSRVRAGEWSDVALADANYLRRTDAEVKVGAG